MFIHPAGHEVTNSNAYGPQGLQGVARDLLGVTPRVLKIIPGLLNVLFFKI